MDPHAENYYSISTYAYAVNNPIVFIDPDGRDIWHINEKGEFEWISRSDTHVAYVVDKDGNRTDKSLELNDRTIFDQLTESTNINRTKVSRANTDGAGADELYKTFLFLADNIDVEWRLDRFNQSGTEGFTLGTIHDSSMAPTAEQLGHSISDVISMIHSHPEVGPNMRDELRSMGSRNGVMITRSDWENVAYYHTTNGKQDFYYYTYFPISGRLYHVNSFQPPSYIRNINRNHKRFFFGTMK